MNWTLFICGVSGISGAVLLAYPIWFPYYRMWRYKRAIDKIYRVQKHLK